MGQQQLFGGGWTEQKLQMLMEYLDAWAKVMKNQPFQRVYIDAFAGTGYREVAASERDSGFFDVELDQEEPQQFFDGSARIALGVNPSFDKFVFVERSASRFAQLVGLKDEFSDRAGSIDFRNEDGNAVLRDLCSKWDYKTTRGVLFLDPFGMQVEWTTLQAVARTRAIDVWILFPLGIGVNRLLPRDGNIPDAWRNRLNMLFGDQGWYDRFYRPAQTRSLFEIEPSVERTGTMNSIADYFQERLRTIFAGVATNPKVLYNSRGMPLFLLCFAVGNPAEKAVAAAMRISQHILGKE